MSTEFVRDKLQKMVTFDESRYSPPVAYLKKRAVHTGRHFYLMELETGLEGIILVLAQIGASIFFILVPFEDNSNQSNGLRTSSTTSEILEELSSKDYQSLDNGFPIPNTIWISNRSLFQGFYTDDPYFDEWRENIGKNCDGSCVTPYGVITFRLHDGIRIDISVDRALRVINYRNNITLAISASGSSAAMIHPNGKVFQYRSRVEILAYDVHNNNNKYAKMWYKGVSFTSDHCALVYLVDSAGTRTTTDAFSDLSNDFSLQVFFSESRHGATYVPEAINLLQSGQYWMTDDGTNHWVINNVRFSQTVDGLVRIGRNSNKFTIRTSPSNGTASVSSPYIHCTGSLGQTRHLFVRRGERRMHYDGTSFIVRNAGHSAGFDEKHQLKVY